MTRKAEFFNVWRYVLVPEETMNRITAVIDIVKEHDAPEGRAAKFIRHEIDLGLQYYPGWREVDAENAPTEGEQYLNEPKEIDWEQRRYEVARTMLPTMFELAMNEKKEMNGRGFIVPKNICKAAIVYADELINQLKPKGGEQ